MKTLRRDIKTAAISAIVLTVPLFLLLGAFWNPHGSIGSEWLALVGLVGLAPLLFTSAELAPRIGVSGFVFACFLQYAWFVLLALIAIRAWRILAAATRS